MNVSVNRILTTIYLVLYEVIFSGQGL